MIRNAIECALIVALALFAWGEISKPLAKIDCHDWSAKACPTPKESNR